MLLSEVGGIGDYECRLARKPMASIFCVEALMAVIMAVSRKRQIVSKMVDETLHHLCGRLTKQ